MRGSRCHNGVWLLAFEGIPDRTGAEGLRGTRLLVDDDATTASTLTVDSATSSVADAEASDSTDGPTEQIDAWYDEDLVGLTVLDPLGARVGILIGVEHGTAQDVLAIRCDDGASAYVPFIAAFVPRVDPAAGVVVIDPPAGLLDLYR